MSMREKNLLARKIVMGLIIAANSCMAGVAMAEPGATELPKDGNVISGNASITSRESAMTIAQSSDKAIIDWQSFNVGSEAKVNFKQPDVSSVTLNRVVGTDMSEIYGQISANGSIILVNPNGAYFADGCKVEAAGLIVSTEDLDHNEFLNDTYVWNQDNKTNANITVMGNIKVSSGETASKLSYANNKIMLIADGDVAIGPKAELNATATTTVSGKYTVGDEGFTVEGDDIVSKGTIILRADQNADDVALVDKDVKSAAGDADVYGNEAFTETSKGEKAGTDQSFKTAKVYLNNKDAKNIQGLNVSVYYNSNITDAGVNGTSVNNIGVYSSSKSSPTTFTQKDYTKIGNEVTAYGKKVTATENFEAYSLVNDVYQLQAIQDVKDVAGKSNEILSSTKAAGKYYGNLAGSYAQGTNIQAADTANWVNKSTRTRKVGFNPIGQGESISFTGNYTGNGGSNSYGIYDMNINRSNEAYVGLFASTSGAKISSTTMVDSQIIGNKNVGGIAGYAEASTFDGNTIRKRYKDAGGATTSTADSANVSGVNSVGGIIGASSSLSSFSNNTNGAYIKGKTAVGGLIGSSTKDTVYDGKNIGWYSKDENVEKGYGVVSGGTNVGGLVGTLSNGSVTGNKGSYSNGQVSGDTAVGGLVGNASDSTIKNSYNTNVGSVSDTVVEKAGDYFDSEDVMGSGTSKYGKVTGKTNVGGIAGVSTNSTLNTVYNAGNISGGTAVGGLVGKMTKSKIKDAYNADNNTVYKSAQAGEDYSFIYQDANNTTKYKYTYNQANQTWSKYSYTVSADNTDTWTLSGESLTTDKVLAEAPESGRLYLNRLAYRDATVTGNDQVGGIVGYIYKTTSAKDDYNEMYRTYNAGRVKFKDASNNAGNIGGLVGKLASGTLYVGSDEAINFFVTTQNVTGKNVVKGDVSMESCGGRGYEPLLPEKTLYEASNVSSSVGAGVPWTSGANQNDKWIVYSNSTTPLLKQFMDKITLNRQYVYDGTYHNITTDGVDNYYGGAFFAGGKGQNVYTKGIDLISDDTYSKFTGGYLSTNKDNITASSDDDRENSSFYRYDNTNIWSPQNGYYTSDTAGVIITPREVTVDLHADKVYGQEARGYVYKYTDDNDKDYYFVNDGTDETKWTYCGDTLPDREDGGQYYVLTLTDEKLDSENKNLKDVINGISQLTIGDDATSIFTGWDTVRNMDNTALSGTDKFSYTSNTDFGEQKLDAKSDYYTTAVKGELDQRDTNKNGDYYSTHNYKFNYKDASLKVDKADLIINASGERKYGDSNGFDGYNFTAVGVAGNTVKDNNVNGKLKSWDVINATASDNVTDMIVMISPAGWSSNYDLYATEATKRNDGASSVYTDRTIDKYTWVAQDKDKKQTSYTLGEGSFRFYGTGGSELASNNNNYNVIFVGNATDGQVQSTTGDTTITRDEYLAKYKEKNSYTINPLELKYDIEGFHTYGDEVNANTPVYTSNLKSWDSVDNLVNESMSKDLADSALEKFDIDSSTHVNRDSNGKVIAVKDDDISSDDLIYNTPLANGSINYTLKANRLKYTVNPATLTVNVSDAEKTYGDATFTNGGSKAEITGFVKGESQDTAYDAGSDTKRANVKLPDGNDSISYGHDEKGTNLAVYNANAGTYEGAATLANKNLYFNDYEVEYNDGGTVTINKKPISYQIDSTSKTYGQTKDEITLTGHFEGVVDGDTLGDVKKVNFTSKGLEKTANANTSYDITLAEGGVDAVKKVLADNGNYVLNTIGEVPDIKTGQLTVNRKPIDYIIDNQTKIYGDTVTLEGHFDTAAIVKADDTFGTVGNENFASDGSDESAEVTDTGKPYSITLASNGRDAVVAALNSNNSNYTLKDVKDGKLYVNPRAIKYQIDSTSKTYGQTAGDMTTLKGQFVGLVNNDKISATLGNDQFKSNGLAAEANVGEYNDLGLTDAGVNAVEAALKASDKGKNYTFETDIVKGTLNVIAKEIDYQINSNTKTYGETAADNGFSGEFIGLVNKDNFNVSSDSFGSKGLSKTADVGDYDIYLNKDVDLQNIVGNNYKIGTITPGKLTVDPRQVDWNTNDATREYLSENPTYSGNFASADSATKTGIIAEDAGKIPSFGQEIYSTGTGFTSEAGEYKGDIHANESVLKSALGNNYVLRNNNNGSTTVTPATFYYKADEVSYPEGSKELDAPVFTGKVVNGAGIDVTQYLQGSDREALNFNTPYEINSETKMGRYAVYGYGVLGNKSYHMAGNPQLPENDTALTITQGNRYAGFNNDSVYEGAKRAPERDVQRNGYWLYGYSNAPEAIRASFRYLTILDSGIHLDTTHVDNSIMVDKSSRTDGGDNITIKRKAVVINNATMAE